MAGRRGSETDIDEMLIARLLEEQAPSLAGLRAVKVRGGWDNAVWRLGDSLTIRITRRAAAAGLHQHEQRWLPVLAPRLPLPVPAPVIAVLDWGDVTAGDAAADLAALWWLFDLNAHGEFWAAYRPVSPAMWHRARAWAALFGLSFLSFGMPGDPATPDTQSHELGRRQLRRVVARQRPP